RNSFSFQTTKQKQNTKMSQEKETTEANPQTTQTPPIPPPHSPHSHSASDSGESISNISSSSSSSKHEEESTTEENTSIPSECLTSSISSPSQKRTPNKFLAPGLDDEDEDEEDDEDGEANEEDQERNSEATKDTPPSSLLFQIPSLVGENGISCSLFLL